MAAIWLPHALWALNKSATVGYPLGKPVLLGPGLATPSHPMARTAFKATPLATMATLRPYYDRKPLPCNLFYFILCILFVDLFILVVI